jgi:hypothetical protein
MNRSLVLWPVRLIVGIVFFFNVTCALRSSPGPGTTRRPLR